MSGDGPVAGLGCAVEATQTGRPTCHPSGNDRLKDPDRRSAFANGREIESIKPSRFESVAGTPGQVFTPGGTREWFATINRVKS